MSNTESLVSSGYLSASVNIGVAKLLRVAESIGVKPAIRLNGVPYFDEAGEDCIRQVLAEQDRERDVERVAEKLRRES